MEWFGRKASKDTGESGSSSEAFAGKKSDVSPEKLPEDGKKRHFPRWVGAGIAVCFAGALVLTFFYGSLAENAKKWRGSRLENQSAVSWLYQNTYLLYRDLCNSQQEASLDYQDIYLKPAEGYEWLLDENELYYRMWPDERPGNEEIDEEETNLLMDLGHEEAGRIQDGINNVRGCFNNLEIEFKNLNSIYDYVIRDDITGKYVTNMSAEEAERVLNDTAGYRRYFLVAFRFDGAGNISVGEICGENEERLRKIANEVIRADTPLTALLKSNLDHARQYLRVKGPANCTVIYAASADSLSYVLAETYITSSAGATSIYYHMEEGVSLETYRAVGLSGILVLCMLTFFLLGLLLPVLKGTRPWEDSPVCSLPFEVLFLLGVLFFAATSLAEQLIVYVAEEQAVRDLTEQLPWEAACCVVMAYNLLLLTAYFFCFWYLGICARAVLKKGVVRYGKERSLIYRFFPFIKRKILGVYDGIQHLDLTQNAHKAIIKILLVNAVILFGISCLWFGGFLVTIVYSCVMYLILRKYISDLQKKYRILLRATNEMAEGHLNVSIEEDLGVFEPFKPQFIRIQDGFRRAVDEEVKSQRMKAELITNVSHDLKTPLTAIITYVNLLQEEGITEQQRREYLKVLETKSLRLKVLIEDLFEVSKANTQNITLNLTEVDIMSLIRQVAFEISDKLQESGLDMRMNLTEEKILLTLDSQKTYRIYENLFGNIAKYAMSGTRVYVNGFRIDDTVVITLKNISAQELTVDSSELTERFVRGDASRNTEGSGLGLAIAKSFTELQGGQLTLETDGDLFKATTVWKMNIKNQEVLFEQ